MRRMRQKHLISKPIRRFINCKNKGSTTVVNWHKTGLCGISIMGKRCWSNPLHELHQQKKAKEMKLFLKLLSLWTLLFLGVGQWLFCHT